MCFLRVSRHPHWMVAAAMAVAPVLGLSRGAGRQPSTCRAWVSAHEAAVVLQRTVRDVRNMVRRHALADIRPGRLRRVSADELTDLIADHPLARAVLEAILDGRLHVAGLDLDAKPPSLMG